MKTLKDLKMEPTIIRSPFDTDRLAIAYPASENGEWINIEDLQNVAKEWLNNNALLGDENHISPEVEYWIKNFFNLEEEE